jgi:Protein of unknown function (DUF2786)
MSPNEKVVDKLRKIRAHQKSAEQIGNEEEAQAFALAFQRILQQHKLDMSDIEWEEHKKEEPIVRVYVSHREAGVRTGKVKVSWMLDLASQIGVAYSVKVLLIDKTRDFFYVGEQTSAEAAKSVYAYMVKVAENLADKEYVKFFYKCKEEGNVTAARGFRQGFLFGFTKRLRQRFNEQITQLSQGHTGCAIIRLSDAIKRAEKYIDDLPDTRDVRTSRQQLPENFHGVRAGIMKADAVRLGDAPRLKS